MLIVPAAGASNATDPSAAAAGVLQRLLPNACNRFRLESIPTVNGCDVFEIDSRDGLVVLRGSSGVAICSALNWYLKYLCGCHISWNGDQLNLPEPLPLPPHPVRIVSRFRFRANFNYCTFGYTMAWWDWPRWEREIDWMALNGVNLPLAATGQEAVWMNTLRQFGMTDEQIRAFLVGPAFSPWQWMANIDHYAGPMPQHWIESHVELGRQILQRERELGMTPILQGFSGFVPVELKEHYPSAAIRQKPSWCDFPGTWQLDPLDPLFAQMGQRFVEEQTKLFGTDHLYAADPFHESAPPRDDPDYLPAVAKVVYGAMATADPQAVWVMQSWSLRPALAKNVPTDRLLVLDIDGRRWKDNDSFWGHPWVWGFINNFGGRTQLGGPLHDVGTEPAQLSNEHANLSGLGAFSEGTINNPVLYDLQFEMAWRDKPLDIDAWVSDYTVRRYGRRSASSAAAWRALADTVYGNHALSESIICCRPALSIPHGSFAGIGVSYDPPRLIGAWRELLTGADQLKTSSPYRYDVVDVGRQVLANAAIPIHQRMADAFHRGDRPAFHAAAQQMFQLIQDMDRLVGSRPEFLLGSWLKSARSWGVDDPERDLYEWNARMLLTQWGPANHPGPLPDYAWREWSGLLNGFYLPRWRMFVDFLDHKLQAGEPYDESKLKMVGDRPTYDSNQLYQEMYRFERSWISGHNEYPDQPQGEAISIARELVEKYNAVYDDLYGPSPARR
jgi:alpha-N-acetylglucosaminidase